MTGSRRDFLLGAGGAAAGVAALVAPAAAAASAGAGRLPLIVTPVSGGRDVDGSALASLRPGDPVDLALAPTDYDDRAVAVGAGGRRVGYVPRRRAEALASLLAAGYGADGVVTEVRTDGPRPEVLVTVHLVV